MRQKGASPAGEQQPGRESLISRLHCSEILTERGSACSSSLLRARDTTGNVVDLHVWRERASWEAVARHLNERGLPAAVPAALVPLLRRRGLHVWPAGERAA